MNVSILFLILIAPILLATLAAANKGDKCQRSPARFWSMIGLGLALFVGMVVFVFFFLAASPDRAHEAGDTAALALVQLSHDGDVGEPVVTNEQLWDRLTESQIILDEEQENVPPTQPEPKMRPDWVDKPPKRVGDVYRAVVASDPFSTVDECFDQLEHRFPGEVQKRLTKLVPSDQRSLIGSETLDGMGVTLDYIMREICREQFTQIVESSVGEMKQVHVLMEFSPAVESHLLDRWQTSQRQYRLTLVARIAALVLATLAVIYGLLQLDTWTRGYYTGRLLWGVPAAIIAIAVVFVFLFGV